MTANVKVDRAAEAGADDSRWASLYTVSGVAALISAVIIPLSIAAFFIWPPFPGSVLDMFTLIQNDKLAGLMSLDFMYLAANFFAIPIFLALYITLKRADESFSAIALALGLIGLVLLIPARPIAEMFSLSNQYAAAATEAQRAQLVAAGEATLALFQGTAYLAHYILGSLSFLISAFIMLRSSIFNRATAYVGIVTNVLVFGLFVPKIGAYISLLSVFPFLMIWLIQIGVRLLRLGHLDGQPSQA